MDPGEKERAERIREKLDALERLSSAVAHKVNNPLTYAVNYLYILRSAVEDEQSTAPLFDKIGQGIKEAKDTLQGLVDLSNPLHWTSMTVDLKALVPSVISLLSPRAQATEIRTGFKGPAIVRASAGLSEVLDTLLMNAIEAGATVIDIGSRDSEDGIVLSVRDNGSGIKAEDLTKIFEPYFTTKPDRTGLRLYASYHIVRLFGGHMSCESREGSGSEFCIFFQRETT